MEVTDIILPLPNLMQLQAKEMLAVLDLAMLAQVIQELVEVELVELVAMQLLVL